jgi:hypothetical protein
MGPAPFIVVVDAHEPPVTFPVTFEELLDRLSRPVPNLVRAVRSTS